jgi:heme A synthase
VLVGALSVLFHAALPMVTMHLGIAALHFANLVALVLVLGPIGRAAFARPPLGGAPAAAS